MKKNNCTRSIRIDSFGFAQIKTSHVSIREAVVHQVALLLAQLQLRKGAAEAKCNEGDSSAGSTSADCEIQLG